jgi:hypothetical protein
MTKRKAGRPKKSISNFDPTTMYCENTINGECQEKLTGEKLIEKINNVSIDTFFGGLPKTISESKEKLVKFNGILESVKELILNCQKASLHFGIKITEQNNYNSLVRSEFHIDNIIIFSRDSSYLASIERIKTKIQDLENWIKKLEAEVK